MYVYWCLRYSRLVIAVEPSSALCDRLRKAYPKNVIVHQCALSDESGAASLRVPILDGNAEFGLATLEVGNSLIDRSTTEVVIRKVALDDLGLTDVGFVKIDVEGYELAVLRGGRKLIEKLTPRLLIECEERHRPNAVGSVREFLEAYGYAGYFVHHSEIKNVEAFDKASMQDPDEDPANYVNNFVFIHKDDLGNVPWPCAPAAEGPAGVFKRLAPGAAQ
jgi:FkbM family methyltransferase